KVRQISLAVAAEQRVHFRPYRPGQNERRHIVNDSNEAPETIQILRTPGDQASRVALRCPVNGPIGKAYDLPAPCLCIEVGRRHIVGIELNLLPGNQARWPPDA